MSVHGWMLQVNLENFKETSVCKVTNKPWKHKYTENVGNKHLNKLDDYWPKENCSMNIRPDFETKTVKRVPSEC